MKSNNNYEDYEDLTLPYDEEDKEHLHQPSKYDIALGKYETNLDDDKIARETAALIEKHLSENDTAEVKKFLFQFFDFIAHAFVITFQEFAYRNHDVDFISACMKSHLPFLPP